MLGPMTYGAAYWSCANDAAVSSMGFDDSKALTPAQRNGLFDRISKVPMFALGVHFDYAVESDSRFLTI